MRKKKLKKALALALTVTFATTGLGQNVYAVSGSEVAVDGSYNGNSNVPTTSMFDGYDIKVSFDVAGGKFSRIETSSTNMQSYNTRYKNKADEKLKGLIGQNATVDMVNGLDATSGATFTVDAMKTAMKDALADAENANPVARGDLEFEDNKVYKVNVELRKASNPSVKSMANDFIAPQAEIWKDADGNLNLAAKFPQGEIFGVKNAHVTGYRLRETDGTNYREFALTHDKENNSFGYIQLPELREDGLYYGVVDANAMKNNQVYLLIDWKSAKSFGTQKDILNKAIRQAKEVSPAFYSKESYDNLQEVLPRAEEVSKNDNSTLKEIFESGFSLRDALLKLKEIGDNPFTSPNQRYYVDVASSDAKVKNSVNYEAVVDNDEEKNSTIRVRFEKSNNYVGEFFANNVEILDVEGEKVAVQSYTFNDESKNGELVFKPSTFPKNGTYKIIVSSNQGNDPIEATLDFDWSTIRTGADFRPINKLIEELSSEQAENYTEKSFANMTKILEEAKNLVANENASQQELNDMVKKLEMAKDKLLIAENNGNANTVNIGFDNLSVPYKKLSEDEADKDWAGSRVFFGKQNVIWRVLDKEQGLLLADEYFVKTKYHNTQSTRPPRWKDSDIRTFLNETLIKELFSEKEKSLIKTTTINQDSRTSDDKIFLLSQEDYMNKDYGFSSDKARKFPERQWTRKRGYSDVQTFETTGKILSVGGRGGVHEYAARPAFYLDMESLADKIILVSSDISENDALKPVKSTKDNIWKLIVKDETIKIEASNLKINDEGKVVGSFSTNLMAGRIKAIIVDKDNNKNVFAYGKVADIIANAPMRMAENSTTGNFEFELPENYDKETSRVMLLAENNDGTANSEGTEINVAEAIDEKDALDRAKEEAKAEIAKLTDLTDEHRTEAIAKVDAMTEPAQKDGIVEEAKAQDTKDREEREAREALDRAKEEAKAEIAKLTDLTDEHRAEAIAKVDAMTEPAQKDGIVEEAKAQDTKDREEREALETAKEEAKAEIAKLADLTDEHRAEAIAKVDAMTEPVQKDGIVEETKTQDTKDREEREALDRAKEEAKAEIAKLTDLTDEHRAEAIAKVDAMTEPAQKDGIVEEAKAQDKLDKAKALADAEKLAKDELAKQEAEKQAKEKVDKDKLSKEKSKKNRGADTGDLRNMSINILMLSLILSLILFMSLKKKNNNE